MPKRMHFVRRIRNWSIFGLPIMVVQKWWWLSEQHHNPTKMKAYMLYLSKEATCWPPHKPIYLCLYNLHLCLSGIFNLLITLTLFWTFAVREEEEIHMRAVRFWPALVTKWQSWYVHNNLEQNNECQVCHSHSHHNWPLLNYHCMSCHIPVLCLL